MTEFAYINWLRARLAAHEPTRALPVGPGDDMAVLRVGGEDLLFAADMLMDGVHFDLTRESAYLAGRKALAVNLSDVAAMAGTPEAIVVSLALPKDAGRQLGEELLEGVHDLARTYGVAIAGGDTNAWRGALAINVAILGRAHRKGSVTRVGAQPGDVIFVTGPLGGSIFGRHLRFTPRVEMARELHERYGIRAMIDLSDGLASDLRHIVTESGCAASLERARIPVHPDVHLYEAGTSALTHALSDGEDFELCFTVRPQVAERILADMRAGSVAPVVPIGEIVARSDGASLLAWSDGTPVTESGYAHSL